MVNQCKELFANSVLVKPFESLLVLHVVILLQTVIFVCRVTSAFQRHLIRRFGEGSESQRMSAVHLRGRSTPRSCAWALNKVTRCIRVKMEMIETYLNSDGLDFPSCDAPVWIFGRSYSLNYDMEELRRSVASCMWITYRKNFPSVGDTSLTSDRGWGCMIRTGQMLLAKALLLRHLGPEWHWKSETKDPAYLKIVSLFADNEDAPFSLHQIAQCGASLGKPVGQWLGPNTACQALKKLIAAPNSVNVDLEIFIAMDSTVVKSSVKRVCTTVQKHIPSVSTLTQHVVSTPRSDPKWKPLLLVVPLRLGLSDLNEGYVPALKAVFEIPQTIGIIGGKPNHALYFIGYADNQVLYLDPHTVQPSVDVDKKVDPSEVAADETYHSDKPGRMSFTSMDPSLALCFFCKSEQDFESLCTKLLERFLLTPLPLFEICDQAPDEWSYTLESSTTPPPRHTANTKVTSRTNLDSVGGGSSSKSHSLYPNLQTMASGNFPNNSDDAVSLNDDSESEYEDNEEFEILG